MLDPRLSVWRAMIVRVARTGPDLVVTVRDARLRMLRQSGTVTFLHAGEPAGT